MSKYLQHLHDVRRVSDVREKSVLVSLAIEHGDNVSALEPHPVCVPVHPSDLVDVLPSRGLNCGNPGGDPRASIRVFSAELAQDFLSDNVYLSHYEMDDAKSQLDGIRSNNRTFRATASRSWDLDTHAKAQGYSHTIFRPLPSPPRREISVNRVAARGVDDGVTLNKLQQPGEDAGGETNVLLLFNMIRAGKLPESKSGACHVLS